jgi:hypothetical protein
MRSPLAPLLFEDDQWLDPWESGSVVVQVLPATPAKPKASTKRTLEKFPVQKTSCKNPFHQLMGRALGPIPQELFFLVGWAEEPVLFIFARDLKLSDVSD